MRFASSTTAVVPFEGALPDGGVVLVGGLDDRKPLCVSAGVDGVWFVNSGREHLVAIREFNALHALLALTRVLGLVCVVSWSLLMLQFLCSCVSC